HADGSSETGGSYDFGMKAFERQLMLGPGTFANFADVGFIGDPGVTANFHDNQNSSNPRFSIDEFTTNVRLGVLEPGDTVSYVYKLIAQGTTAGFEHGFMAFVGDPFGADITEGNLQVSADPVPEPATWVLSLL